MRGWRAAARFCQAVLCPQVCVLCDARVLHDDWSPLCRRCLCTLKSLRGTICYFCGIPLPGVLAEKQAQCSRCRTHPPAFDRARSYGLYGGNLRRLIRQFKFGGRRGLARPLSRLLLSCYGRSRLEPVPHWIVPVPLHSRRRRQRGYDQSLLLGRQISRRLGIPLFKGLRRTRDTLPQSGLDGSGRRENVRGAFALSRPDPLRDCHLMLVDDVMTTGTTVSEIAGLLRRVGKAGQITVLTLARVSVVRPLG